MSSKTVFSGKADGVIPVPPGDDVQTACLLAVGLVSGHVGLTGIPDDILVPRDDAAALMKRKRLGIDIRNGAVFAKKSVIANFDVDTVAYPDAVPALIAMFCVGSGSCVISGAAGADYEQGYQMRKLADALAAIGAHIKVSGDDIVITGQRRLFGGTAYASGYAPVAMALSIAALRCETLVTIADVPGACDDYFHRLSALGILVQ